jgi:hypothetical protein
MGASVDKADRDTHGISQLTRKASAILAGKCDGRGATGGLSHRHNLLTLIAAHA